MTIDELKRALECHAKDDCCSVCPFNDSENCSEDMALAALDALDTKAEPLDQRQMALKTVMMALDKGDQHIMVSPDGSVSMWPDTPTKGWISVNDAKPDKNGDYLVYRGHAVSDDWLKTNDANWLVGICQWNEKMGGWYRMRDNEVDKTVTHWMELPTAPEGWG